jgi:glycerophosphoryl diester phosphodiesterase
LTTRGSCLGFALGALLCAQAKAEPTILERLNGARVCAHRGGGYGHVDANTIERFDMAVRDGADVVETDLQLSLDGVPFMFHDDDMEPNTTCFGHVEGLTAKAIEHCRLHTLRHGPQRFEDALRWSQGRVVIDAEFKTLDVIRPAIDLVRRYGAYEWVYFQVGYQQRFYDEARAYDPRVALEYAPRGPDSQLVLDRLLQVRDPRLISVQLHPELASESNIQAIRRSGKIVSADGFRFGDERQWNWWPFPTVAFCTDLYQRGINVVITNLPASCARQRDASLR